MKKLILAAAAIGLFCSVLTAEALVNIKYAEMEKKTKTSFEWNTGKITVEKEKKKIQLYPDCEYLTYKKYRIKLDKAPIIVNEKILISEYTYNKIVEILEKKYIPTKIPNLSVPEAPSEVVLGETPVLIKEKEGQSPKEVKLIVIDPGHGGHDPGATGPTGLREKDVVLDIGVRLRRYLADKNIKVIMTRDTDVFIALKERAGFANKNKVDLFISLHANASRDGRAQGTRSYIYGRIATSKEAEEAAKFENKSIGMFEMLLNDLRKGAFEYLSIEAAGNIQHSIVKAFNCKWKPGERAPFYVIAKTNMPSVLIETAFISNPAEEQKLRSVRERDRMAQAIAEGIREYMGKIK
ncbi:MAG: N-acetylmuramoyl-L-alanine amidase [bacterium]